MAKEFAPEGAEYSAIDGLPAISSSGGNCAGNVEAQLYSTAALAATMGVGERQIRNYANEVREAWDWLPMDKFKQMNKHTEFSAAQMRSLKEFRAQGGSYEEWKSNIQKHKPQPQIEKSEPPSVLPVFEGEVVEEELLNASPMTAIAQIRQNRYEIPQAGSNRLAKAQEAFQQQQLNLEDTRKRVQQALMGLAIQTKQTHEAENLERSAHLQHIYESAYAERLEELQVRIFAKTDADKTFQSLQHKVAEMGNAHGQAC